MKHFASMSVGALVSGAPSFASSCLSFASTELFGSAPTCAQSNVLRWFHGTVQDKCTAAINTTLSMSWCGACQAQHQLTDKHAHRKLVRNMLIIAHGHLFKHFPMMSLPCSQLHQCQQHHVLNQHSRAQPAWLPVVFPHPARIRM